MLAFSNIYNTIYSGLLNRGSIVKMISQDFALLLIILEKRLMLNLLYICECDIDFWVRKTANLYSISKMTYINRLINWNCIKYMYFLLNSISCHYSIEAELIIIARLAWYTPLIFHRSLRFLLNTVDWQIIFELIIFILIYIPKDFILFMNFV